MTAELPPTPMPDATPARSCWWCIVASLVPYVAIFIAHFSNPHGVPTGFIQGDMPYYSANGRAIFERGNGFAYPNPYDPDEDAPAIYFHWLIWILGAGIALLGFDPGVWFVTVGLIAALATSYLTWRLVCEVLPRAEFRRTLFLAAMWGGGLFVVAKLGANALRGVAPLAELTGFDPWCFNWGRNIAITTQATYHALAAGCLVFTLRGRDWLGLSCAGLLAATHPWSGLEWLLILAAYWGLRTVFAGRFSQANRIPSAGTSRSPHSAFRVPATKLLAVAAMLAIFLGYNLVYLESFEQHRGLREVWQLDWSVSWGAAVLAWGPVLVLATLRLLDRRFPCGRREMFLLTMFAVAFLLSIHDRFIKPTQPLHFTHGYVWMPLFLLGLPYLQQRLIDWRSRPSIPATIGVALLGLVLVADNLTFVLVNARAQRQPDAEFVMTRDQWDMVRWIDANGIEGVVVTHNDNFSYLLATYTRLRPYSGHVYNTPERLDRIRHINRLLETSSDAGIEWFQSVDCLVLQRKRAKKVQQNQPRIWKPVYSSGDLVLLKREAFNRRQRASTRRMADPHKRGILTRGAPTFSRNAAVLVGSVDVILDLRFSIRCFSLSGKRGNYR